MKKTLLTSTMLAAATTLIISGSVWAHHPSLAIAEEMDTANPLNSVDNISEQHIIIVDGLLEEAEDDSMMANTAMGADSSVPTTAEGDGSNATTTMNDGAVPTDSAAGISSASQARTAGGAGSASQAGGRAR